VILSSPARTATPSKEEKKEKPIDHFVGGGIILHSKLGERGASGCPIGPDVLLTAAHVWENTKKHGDLAAIVEVPEGVRPVLLESIWMNVKKDIGLLRVKEDEHFQFSKWFTLRKKSSHPGDRLKMLVNNPNAQDGIIFGNIAWIESDGALMLDMAGFPGVSGSCVLDEEESVVAIISGVWAIENIAMRPFMKAVSVKEVK
jgi:hypothetical protein